MNLQYLLCIYSIYYVSAYRSIAMMVGVKISTMYVSRYLLGIYGIYGYGIYYECVYYESI